MSDRPAPPPLVIANVPCSACRQPTGYDAWRRWFFCNYCGIQWPSDGMHAAQDELAGEWVGPEPRQHSANNV